MEAAFIVLGLLIGYYARTMKAILEGLQFKAEQARHIKQEAKADTSAVIRGGSVVGKKGGIADMPDYDSNLVRSPTPLEVKADEKRQFEQELNEYDPMKHTHRIF
jgi:hypothetical protein